MSGLAWGSALWSSEGGPSSGAMERPMALRRQVWAFLFYLSAGLIFPSCALGNTLNKPLNSIKEIIKDIIH
jgi:hypothetical protein